MKACKRCGVNKPLSEFYKSPRNLGGLTTNCKLCHKEIAHVRWVKNKKEMYARNKRWAQANPEKLYLYQKQKSPEMKREIHKNWASKNREHLRSYAMERRARQKNNGTYDILPKHIKRLYMSSCLYCGSSENITADHVIPINKGGVHSIGNLVPACSKCNSSKHDHTIMEWRLRGMRKNII